MKFIADIVKNNWFFDEEELSNYYIDIKIGFRNNGKLPVVFDQMSFGYSLMLGNNKISDDKMPPENVLYKETYEDFIHVFRVYDLIPQKEYTINVWTKNSDNFWDGSFSFILPLPVKMFPSYILDEETGRYLPPVPVPDNENSYVWDEESISWKLVQETE